MNRYVMRQVLFLLIPCISPVALAQAPWQLLLGADSIQAWRNAGESPADYEWVGDTVVGRPIGNNPKNAFLCSPEDYRDFELRFDFRIRPGHLNSGVQFRSEVLANGIVAGPQLEMDVQNPDD
ncbi:MAG: DUF1080 domain-containing protein, partial [Halioglobus sp.]|nr:DUF1080 domain-containing protein [Halioglobus sp.]